jgi:hypothetical protein
LVLRGHVFWTVGLWTLIVCGPTLCAVARFLGGHPEPDPWAPWIVSAVCTAIGALGLLIRETVTVTPLEIRKTGPFMRQQQMSWQDVVSVDFRNGGVIWLLCRNETRIRIPSDLVGIADLANVLEWYLPDHVLRDCAHDLQTYRKFIRRSK